MPIPPSPIPLGLSSNCAEAMPTPSSSTSMVTCSSESWLRRKMLPPSIFDDKPVLDGIFHQRLQQHAGHHHVERIRIEFFHHFQLVAAKADDFDIEIVVDEINLVLQGHEGVAANAAGGEGWWPA